MTEHDLRVPRLAGSVRVVGGPWWSVLLLAAILVGCGVVAVLAERYELLSMGLVLCLLVASLVVVSVRNRTGRDGRLRIGVDEAGTWLGAARSAGIGRLVCTALSIVCCVPGLVWGRSILFSVAVTVLCLLATVDAAVRLGHPHRLGLTTEGLVRSTGWGLATGTDWEQVGIPRLDERGGMTVPLQGAKDLVIAGADLDSDPRAVRALITHYRTSAARRRELVGGGVVRTITAGVLPVE